MSLYQIVTNETQNSDTEIEDAVFNSGSYVSAEDVTPTELKEYPMDVLKIDGSEVIDAEVVTLKKNQCQPQKVFYNLNIRMTHRPKLQR